MSEMRQILEDTCAKLFARFEEPAMLRRVEAGEWPPEIWAAIDEAGLDQIFSGASDDPWRDACVVLKACGRHVLPAPLAETLMARALFPDAPDGAIVLVAATDRKPRQPISREPIDHPGITVMPVARGEGPPWQYGALARAAQMAGCIEAVLAMTVQYARERQQFGKPIGSFQAIQHQLAILAGHSAAATRAVDAAFERIAEGGYIAFEAAVAKIRCGEAAGVAASIAHQTHGAIGFTDEHRLHYYTRRLWSWRSEFGSEAYWSGVLGRRVAADGADGFWPLVTAAG